MRVMVIVKGTTASESGALPDEAILTEMGRFNEELATSGVLLAGEGLQPSSRGVRVRYSGSERTVIDGPFTEAKELVAGFWLWQVRSLDEAIAWARRCPNPMPGSEGEIEIRPVMEPDDFGENLTAELREREALLRAQATPAPWRTQFDNRS